MGCDIHFHGEINIDGVWHHYNNVHISRWYELFEQMAGVRGIEENAIIPPRGIPEDATFLTRWDLERWNSDAHTVSWFGPQEIQKLAAWYKFQWESRKIDKDASEMFRDMVKKATGQKYVGGWGTSDLFGYLQGNAWEDFIECPDDVHEDIKDIRWIFWFDN